MNEIKLKKNQNIVRMQDLGKLASASDVYVDSLVQDCSISIANTVALEILQSCIKLICDTYVLVFHGVWFQRSVQFRLMK